MCGAVGAVLGRVCLAPGCTEMPSLRFSCPGLAFQPGCGLGTGDLILEEFAPVIWP